MKEPKIMKMDWKSLGYERQYKNGKTISNFLKKFKSFVILYAKQLAQNVNNLILQFKTIIKTSNPHTKTFLTKIDSIVFGK